ncbi:ABC transporter permease [Allobaculum mucilyticum]|uniref:ABC transporter permease n=1 Tax=Allobaculum mucilyticum TaxID=2834459 RepID=UPI001E418754|nr:ABC transporter permease [Allobaculum mucilyticum]UNT95829.1 ABC transporter permease [Allobaculum mucilyticum]
MKSIREFYEYRELLKTNVRKDIRGRYKGSFLGVLWTFLTPLLQVLVYYIVFPYLMAGGMPNFLVYLITGIFPWNFFQTSIVGATGCIKANEGVVKKVYFPRKILVLSQILSGLVNYFISIPIMLIFCVVFHIPLTWNVLWLPVIGLVEALFIYGCGLILAAINVYVQDVANIVQFLLNLAFYGTPIVYSLSLFPSKNILAVMIRLNPLTMIVDMTRAVTMDGILPSFTQMGIVFALGVVITVFGTWVFDKLQKGFAEEL